MFISMSNWVIFSSVLVKQQQSTVASRLLYFKLKTEISEGEPQQWEDNL